MSVESVEEFLFLNAGPIFDVRSPGEFAKGHIPGSVSFPLFSDEERAKVGTAYKQQGHDQAVLLGLGLVGPKLRSMAEVLHEHMRQHGNPSCRLLCYRGGMRSASVAWLANFLRFPCIRLAGGYKSYRSYVLKLFEKKFSFRSIGGPTGSGKTELLKKLKAQGHQVLDLEELANHRGSAFGLLPGHEQPTIEQFENRIAGVLSSFDSNRPIFVEDESRSIGSCCIPKVLYDQISISPLIWLEVDREARLLRILEHYGQEPKEWLMECTKKLAKRLGGERVATICRYIESGALREATYDLMAYYDATYEHSLHTKSRPIQRSTEDLLLQ